MDNKATSAKSEAMSSLTLVLMAVAALAAGIWLGVALTRTVRADGLGHRPPPARHPGTQGGL